MSAKDVSRFAQTSLTQDVYKRVLLSGHHIRSYNIRIGSSKRLLRTIRNNKISFAFDDKGFSQNDGIHCLPFGHLEIKGRQMHREILEDDEWGEMTSERKPQKVVQVGLLESGTSQFLLATFHRFQTLMLTVNQASIKPKHKSQMRYSPLLTLECINLIARKVNWKKSLTPMQKERHIQVLDKETLSFTTKLKKIPIDTSIQTMTM